MKAKELKIHKFLSNNDTQFIIPVYQRNYDWEKQQCKQLIKDIEENCNNQEGHFVGSIVYTQEFTTAGEIDKLIIIDGQQRITTITLIYIVLYKFAKSIGEHKLVEQINEKYLINKFDSNKSKLKLKVNENDSKALEYLLINDDIDEFDEKSSIIKNYKYFEEYINNENYNNILKGLLNLIFVEIAIEDNDNPQKIFESLNSTGLDLSEADLIRNFILVGLDFDDQTRIYQNFWKPIEQYAKNEDTNISLVSDFIRDYLTIKIKKIPNKNKVYYEYREESKNLFKPNLEIHLTELLRFAKHYSKLVNPSKEKNDKIRLQLKYMNQLDIHVSYPFLLYVYDDYYNKVINDQEFLNVLNLIESYICRRFIVEDPTNILNKLFAILYDSINKENYLESLEKRLCSKTISHRFPTDKDVIKSLKTRAIYKSGPKKRLYVLAKLENFDNKESSDVLDNQNITIEHIFPQKPRKEWKEDLAEEEYKKFENDYLHTLANLTLSGYNSELGNKAFLEKRDTEGGYKSSSLWLNKYLSEIDNFDIEALYNRREILTERFLEVWKRPIVPDDVEDGNDLVNIFEIENAAGIKISKFEFFSKEYSVKNVTQMYEKVFSILLQKNPEELIDTKLGEKIELTKDINKLRSALKISGAYYIEKSLSSTAKFWRIRKVLEKLGYEDELVITHTFENN